MSGDSNRNCSNDIPVPPTTMLCLGWNESAKEIYSIFIEILLNFRRKGNTFFADMQIKIAFGGDFFRNGNNFIETHLNKTHFLLAGSSFGLPSVVSRSSLGKTRQGTREVQRTRILIIVLNTNRVGGKRCSFSPTLVFRPLTPPYMRFRIRRFFVYNIGV